MASITEIRSSGTTLVSIPKPILEPLDAPALFKKKLARFGEHYNLSTDSHLYKFLVTLCGDAGAGSLKKELLYPKLQSLLGSTFFHDLDRLYGNPLGLPRLSTEIYSVDPRNEALTNEEWDEIKLKDALYRARCLIWMRAIIAGPTEDGIRLAAESAIGAECNVYEQYKWLDNDVSDNPVTIPNLGQTVCREEFIIIPLVDVTESDKRRITQQVDRLRPVHTIPSTYDPDTTLRTEITPQSVEATSEFFVVNNFVIGRSDISWPPVDSRRGEWIEPGVEKEAPLFAFMQRQENTTYLSIFDVQASTEHFGVFSPEQQELFQHLRVAEADDVFRGNKSIALAVSPIQLTIPWVA